jgi:hypothetical protein
MRTKASLGVRMGTCHNLMYIPIWAAEGGPGTVRFPAPFVARYG